MTKRTQTVRTGNDGKPESRRPSYSTYLCLPILGLAACMVGAPGTGRGERAIQDSSTVGVDDSSRVLIAVGGTFAPELRSRVRILVDDGERSHVLVDTAGLEVTAWGLSVGPPVVVGARRTVDVRVALLTATPPADTIATTSVSFPTQPFQRYSVSAAIGLARPTGMGVFRTAGTSLPPGISSRPADSLWVTVASWDPRRRGGIP